EVLVDPCAVQVRPADGGAEDVGPVDVVGVNGDEAGDLGAADEALVDPGAVEVRPPQGRAGRPVVGPIEGGVGRLGGGKRKHQEREKGEEKAGSPAGQSQSVPVAPFGARVFDPWLRTKEPMPRDFFKSSSNSVFLGVAALDEKQ